MEAARLKVQQLLDEFYKLDIGDIENINELQVQPQKVYNKKIDSLVDVPKSSSKFKIKKEAMLATLDLPDPGPLCKAAQASLKISYGAVPDLFEISERTVVLNTQVSEFYISMNDVRTNDPEKIKLFEDIKKYVELSNILRDKIGLPLSHPAGFQFFRGIFSVTQKSFPAGLYSLEIIPQNLKKWIQG